VHVYFYILQAANYIYACWHTIGDRAVELNSDRRSKQREDISPPPFACENQGLGSLIQILLPAGAMGTYLAHIATTMVDIIEAVAKIHNTSDWGPCETGRV